ncbi:hypothetical protein BBSC_2039 [Bifidobacterium scardovii JCM 12489 = DSM 13734]|nr:hypothetical protein BBSC_2039 [Bifidobacterium scardovii JCM 12489 = DSM 13734]
MAEWWLVLPLAGGGAYAGGWSDARCRGVAGHPSRLRRQPKPAGA